MFSSKIRACTILLSFFSIVNLFSQEQSIFYNDYLDPFITNPACTGAEYYPVAHLSAEKQWVGFTGSPSTFLLSGNYRIGNYDFYDPKGLLNKGPLQLRDRSGIGAAIFQDNNGPLSNTGGLLSYAYHLPVNEGSRLAFGLSVLLVNYSLNGNMLNPDQKDDNYLLTGNINTFKVNFGTGLYYHNSGYFAGVSVNKFLPGISNVNETTKVLPSYFAMGGYKFNKKSKAFNFEPSFELKKLGGASVIVDLHAKLYVRKYNWISVSYSTSQQINFRLGLQLYKMAYFGYNYGLTLTNIAPYNYGTHEISLGINLGLVGVEGIRNRVE
jgi:type IX secretion system PorP/SprF family membrane protein